MVRWPEAAVENSAFLQYFTQNDGGEEKQLEDPLARRDPGMAEELRRFRKYCVAKHGSLSKAFAAADDNDSQELSISEFRDVVVGRWKYCDEGLANRLFRSMLVQALEGSTASSDGASSIPFEGGLVTWTEFAGREAIRQAQGQKAGVNLSRQELPGLPMLPWCFGRDARNTVVMDMETDAISPFQCVFMKSQVQPSRACVVHVGNTYLAPTYVVCPKFQHMPVRDGFRVVCGQSWTLELRIRPTGLHSSALTIVTDEGWSFEVPDSGCHVGAGHRAVEDPATISFPKDCKMSLQDRLQNISTVHCAFHYHRAGDRWSIVDHSDVEEGTLIELLPGFAYPLSHGLRVKTGPITMEVITAAAPRGNTPG